MSEDNTESKTKTTQNDELLYVLYKYEVKYGSSRSEFLCNPDQDPILRKNFNDESDEEYDINNEEKQAKSKANNIYIQKISYSICCITNENPALYLQCDPTNHMLSDPNPTFHFQNYRHKTQEHVLATDYYIGYLVETITTKHKPKINYYPGMLIVKKDRIKSQDEYDSDDEERYNEESAQPRLLSDEWMIDFGWDVKIGNRWTTAYNVDLKFSYCLEQMLIKDINGMSKRWSDYDNLYLEVLHDEEFVYSWKKKMFIPHPNESEEQFNIRLIKAYQIYEDKLIDQQYYVNHYLEDVKKELDNFFDGKGNDIFQKFLTLLPKESITKYEEHCKIKQKM